jgi:hypothetical protein
VPEPSFEVEQPSAQSGIADSDAEPQAEDSSSDEAVPDTLPVLADDDSSNNEDEAISSYLGMEYHPESRLTKPSPAGYLKEAPVELPPLPEEPDDTLIDEAVRFEPRPEPKRSVPSWLFEDLESDLAGTGSAGADDPIDHFHDATPLARSSALDRLLANDEAASKKSNDTGNGQPLKGPANRPTRRDDD